MTITNQITHKSVFIWLPHKRIRFRTNVNHMRHKGTVLDLMMKSTLHLVLLVSVIAGVNSKQCGGSLCQSGEDCISVGGSLRCADPCNHYSNLNDSWRSTNISSRNQQIHCDKHVTWKGWYRMFLQGTSVPMPETCVEDRRCGTHAPLWLAESHPELNDGVVKRKVCGHWNGNCCYFKSNPIHVKACRGNFYVYKFVKPVNCALAYCADAICDSCGNNEICVRSNASWTCQAQQDDGIVLKKLFSKQCGGSLCQSGEDCISVGGSLRCADPCNHYSNLNDSWRSTNISSRNQQIHCDNGLTWKGWYRMFLQGTSVPMPETCVEDWRCGTHAPLWLAESHPELKDGVVKRKVCGHWNGNCCYFKSNPIHVKACRGNFYVYKFVKPVNCALAYCADAICDSCGNNEICIRSNASWTCQAQQDDGIVLKKLFSKQCGGSLCQSGEDCISVGGSLRCADPCNHYSNLNDSWRSTNISSRNQQIHCDKSVTWKGWYRMFLQGTSVPMPETCVEDRRCGTHAPLWLAESHPELKDGVVKRKVCGHWNGNCCYFKSNPIHVKACRGNFYIYKFVKPHHCHLAYCADAICDSCGNNEICVRRNASWTCQAQQDDGIVLKRAHVAATVQPTHAAATVQPTHAAATVQPTHAAATVQPTHAAATVQPTHVAATVQPTHVAATVQPTHAAATVQPTHVAATVQPTHAAATVQPTHVAATVQPTHVAATVQPTHVAATVQPTHAAATVQPTHAAATVQPTHVAATVQPTHVAATVQPTHVAATVQPTHAAAKVQPTHAAATVQPTHVAATVQPTHAAATVQPTHAAATVQPTHAAATVQPTHAAATVQPTHAAATVQPTHVAATVQPTHVAATVQPTHAAATVQPTHVAATVQPTHAAATVQPTHVAATVQPTHVAATVQPTHVAATVQPTHVAATVQPTHAAATVQPTHVAATVQPTHVAATVQPTHAAATVQPTHVAATVQPTHVAATVQPTHVAATVQPTHAAAKVQPTHAAATVQPTHVAATVQPTHAAATVQPTHAAATVQPTHAAATVQPTHAAATVQPTHAAATVQPTHVAAKVQPTHVAATVQPTHVAATVQPTHAAATVQPTHVAATVQPTHAAATVQPTHVAATVQPTHVAATVQPTHVAATVQPTHAAATVQPTHVAATVQPTHAAATVQPTHAAAKVQPTHAAATVQPTHVAATVQPTHAAATVQPTHAAAKVQPTHVAAKVQPALLCGMRIIELGLPGSYLEYEGLIASSGHMADPLCSALEQRNGTVWYRVERTAGKCGNTMTINGTHATYANTLFVYPDEDGEENSSLPDPVSFTFSCIYPMDTETSMQVAIRPQLRASNANAIVGVGPQARASMSLYRNPNFTAPYPAGPVTIPVGATLYVGVTIDETDANHFVVVLEDCYATQTQSSDDPKKYFLIQNRCATNHRQVSVTENGSSLQARFSARLFLFQRDFTSIFLHCTLGLRDRSRVSVSPSCQGRRSRSVSDALPLNPVIIGPITWE